MDRDLGSTGLLYLAAMSIGFGLLAQAVMAGRPEMAVGAGTSVHFGVGIVSEFWFGWATEDDLQPNIDGLSRDECC